MGLLFSVIHLQSSLQYNIQSSQPGSCVCHVDAPSEEKLSEVPDRWVVPSTQQGPVSLVHSRDLDVKDCQLMQQIIPLPLQYVAQSI